MDILIPNVDVPSTKEIGLDTLPLASSYAKDAILSQRKRIDEIILANMDKSYPAIELSFGLFDEIEREMFANGWCKQEGGWWHPIGLIERYTEVQIKDEENKVISAATFYNSTMKQQLIELHAEIDKAREKGLRSVELKFPLYQVIVDKLKEQGWNVYVHNNFYSSATPYTSLKAK